MEQLSSVKVAGGQLVKVKWQSKVLQCVTQANVFLPGKTPIKKTLLWLSGLTCNEDNFAQKAGAFKAASALSLAIIMPDTSPRSSEGNEVPDDAKAWDFGQGAGFYLDATKAPYSTHYRMASFITTELLDANVKEVGIMGHSMGGHGALTLGLKYPGRFTTISAFAPICHPSACPWGQKAFDGYLATTTEWGTYDATELVQKCEKKMSILIDQGTKDSFYTDGQLLPEDFVRAAPSNVAVQLRLQDGYDHSYYFISTFIEDHLAFHLDCTK